MPRKKTNRQPGKATGRKAGVDRGGGQTARTKEEVIAALQVTYGTTYLAAQRLGVSHATVLNYAKRWPEVGELLTQKRGEIVDTAEVVMFKAVAEGDVNAAKWVLERLAKDRGYSQQQQIELTQRAEVREVVVRTREEARKIISLMAEADRVR